MMLFVLWIQLGFVLGYCVSQWGSLGILQRRSRKGERSHLVLSGSAESQSQQHSIHKLFLNREEERTREREEKGERTERRKEAELWVHKSSLQLCQRPCHLLALHSFVLP